MAESEQVQMNSIIAVLQDEVTLRKERGEFDDFK